MTTLDDTLRQSAPRTDVAMPAGTPPRGWRLKFARAWGLVASVALLAGLWVSVAPPSLGGRTSFSVASGHSMLPHFRSGDLVVLRREQAYRVGEVAAYHNERLHMVVMHRIIAIEGTHYVFKGDNNDFVDSYSPTAGQIFGAEWIHFRNLGHYIEYIRIPGVAAALCALLWLASFSPTSTPRRRPQRERDAP